MKKVEEGYFWAFIDGVLTRVPDRFLYQPITERLKKCISDYWKAHPLKD